MGQLVFGPYDNSVFDAYYYDDDYTFRVWIPPALLTECSKFRIGFGYYSTQNVYIDAVYVGQSSGATADSAFDGTPTAVLFSGVAAVTYNSAVKYSDYVEYDIDPTKGLIISMEFGASHSYMPYVEVATGDEADIVTYRDYGDYADSSSFSADATYETRRHLVVSIGNVFELDDDLSNLKSDANINHAHQSNAISATADIGAGDNGVVTTTVDTAGTDGNNYTIEVVAGVGVDQAMSAAILAKAVTVTLGTDGAGDPDDTKNTATLITAAIEALANVSASASGTGATPLTGAEGPTSFTGGVDQWRTFDALSDMESTGEVEWNYVVDDLPDVQLTGFGKIGFIDLDDGVLSDLQCTGRTGDNGELGYYEPVYLPDMRCEGQTGERADLDANLPDLQCTGYTGAQADNTLPDLEISATGTAGQVGNLDETLPDLDCTAYAGSRCGILTLPDLQIEATASGSYATLDAKIPALIIEAEGSTPTTGVLDMDLTFPTFDGEMSLDCRLNLNADLSNLKISSTLYGPRTLILDATLPDLKVNAELKREVAGELDDNLPGLRIESTAHCTPEISLESDLPALKLSSTLYGPRTLNLDATLSDLKIEAELKREVSGELDTDLPGLRIEGTAHCTPEISLENDLPNLKLSSTAYGPRTLVLDATLSDLKIEAELKREVSGNLDTILPGLRIESTAHCTPEISLESDLPNLKLSSTAYGPRTLTLDATLSDLKIEAELRREVTGSLDTDLPGLRIEGAGHCDLDTISLDENLPILGLEASGYSGEVGTLDATLSNLTIEASILSEEIGDLDATLPALVMGDTRTGGTGGESGTISYLSRFADYILRHTR